MKGTNPGRATRLMLRRILDEASIANSRPESPLGEKGSAWINVSVNIISR